MPESYRDVAALLNQVARKFGDLRFVNTCLKILDARKTGSTEQEEIRLECSGILEEHE